MVVRDANQADCVALAAIYNHYILETVVSFEETTVSADDMWRRVVKMQEHHHWLVAEAQQQILGYAYSGPWHTRAAYRHSAEVSVYLEPNETGRGVGTRLYQELLDRLSAMGVHTVIGGVALPNDASVALHKKLGFKQAAHYEQVGYKHGRWIDVAYWQLLLAGRMTGGANT